jgi:methionyl-tRNA formyltransferase
MVAPRLAEMGAPLMVETLAGLKAGTITPRKQDDSRASLAPILKREDGLMDFRRSAHELGNRLRGFQPWPGAYTTFRGKKLNVWDAREHSAVSNQHSAGELRIEQDRLFVGCGRGTELELITVQPEGKKRMPARDFVHGYRPRQGERLGIE